MTASVMTRHRIRRRAETKVQEHLSELNTRTRIMQVLRNSRLRTDNIRAMQTACGSEPVDDRLVVTRARTRTSAKQTQTGLEAITANNQLMPEEESEDQLQVETKADRKLITKTSKQSIPKTGRTKGATESRERTKGPIESQEMCGGEDITLLKKQIMSEEEEEPQETMLETKARKLKRELSKLRSPKSGTTLRPTESREKFGREEAKLLKKQIEGTSEPRRKNSSNERNGNIQLLTVAEQPQEHQEVTRKRRRQTVTERKRNIPRMGDISCTSGSDEQVEQQARMTTGKLEESQQTGYDLRIISKTPGSENSEKRPVQTGTRQRREKKQLPGSFHLERDTEDQNSTETVGGRKYRRDRRTGGPTDHDINSNVCHEDVVVQRKMSETNSTATAPNVDQQIRRTWRSTLLAKAESEASPLPSPDAKNVCSMNGHHSDVVQQKVSTNDATVNVKIAQHRLANSPFWEVYFSS